MPAQNPSNALPQTFPQAPPTLQAGGQPLKAAVTPISEADQSKPLLRRTKCCLVSVLIAAVVAYLFSHDRSRAVQVPSAPVPATNFTVAHGIEPPLLVPGATACRNLPATEPLLREVRQTTLDKLNAIKGVSNQLIAAIGGESVYQNLPRVPTQNVKVNDKGEPLIQLKDVPGRLFRSETSDGRSIIGFKYKNVRTGEVDSALYYQTYPQITPWSWGQLLPPWQGDRSDHHDSNSWSLVNYPPNNWPHRYARVVNIQIVDLAMLAMGLEDYDVAQTHERFRLVD